MPGKKRKQIPLFDLQLNDATIRKVKKTLESGWLTPGQHVIDFEKEISRLMRVRYATAVSSATDGLRVMLRAIGAERNREIITTPFTFVATAGAIIETGATPVFADIDPATLNIDPDEVQRKITKNTQAILAVDMAGCPVDYHALNRIADDNSLVLLSDSAHAIGASVGKLTIPNMCDGSVLSFYSTKNLTCGEGGMILTRHKVLAEKVRRLSRHGITKSTFDRAKKSSWQYDVTDSGYKANMSEVHASIGLGQLKSFGKDQIKRAKIASRYVKRLSCFADYMELPHTPKNITHGWHLFILRLKLSSWKIDRDTFIRRMADRSVQCGVHYIPLFEFTWYKRHLGLKAQYYPNATYAGERVVTLPLYPALSMREVDIVCDAIAELVETYGK